MALRVVCMQIHFILLISRQGKVRLTKWYSSYPSKEKGKIVREKLEERGVRHRAQGGEYLVYILER